jgi:hypothetical protein
MTIASSNPSSIRPTYSVFDRAALPDLYCEISYPAMEMEHQCDYAPLPVDALPAAEQSRTL